MNVQARRPDACTFKHQASRLNHPRWCCFIYFSCCCCLHFVLPYKSTTSQRCWTRPSSKQSTKTCFYTVTLNCEDLLTPPSPPSSSLKTRRRWRRPTAKPVGFEGRKESKSALWEYLFAVAPTITTNTTTSTTKYYYYYFFYYF